MIRRFASALILVWLLGFLAFAVLLPQPRGAEKTDAVVVFTGGDGRIQRGLEAIETGWSPRLFISGVDPEVRSREFEVQYKVPKRTMACCVTLGFASYDTRSNAEEVKAWLAKHKCRTVRLVTSDWHMRRAALELERELPGDMQMVRDAVPTEPSLRILFLEYHKLLATYLLGLLNR